MNSVLHQIHPILPVKNVLGALSFYVNKLSFKIAFADDSKNPNYAGIIKDHVEIHLKGHEHLQEHGLAENRPTLRIVTQNIEHLYQECNFKNLISKGLELKVTNWGTREFTIYDPDNNGLTFYENNLTSRN